MQRSGEIDTKFTAQTNVLLQCISDSFHSQFTFHSCRGLKPTAIALTRPLAGPVITWDIDTQFHGPLSSV